MNVAIGCESEIAIFSHKVQFTPLSGVTEVMAIRAYGIFLMIQTSEEALQVVLSQQISDTSGQAVLIHAWLR